MFGCTAREDNVLRENSCFGLDENIYLSDACLPSHENDASRFTQNSHVSLQQPISATNLDILSRNQKRTLSFSPRAMASCGQQKKLHVDKTSKNEQKDLARLAEDSHPRLD